MAIAGIWTAATQTVPEARVRSVLAGSGAGTARPVVDAEAMLAMGGAQPLARSSCGRYLLVLDGMAHLGAGQPSLAAAELVERFARPGGRLLLHQLDGAFALALWDSHQRQLLLARDPAGQRPLYYAWLEDGFAFASTLQGLRGDPAFNVAVEPGVLALFLRHGHVPAPHCIHRGAFKLQAGSMLQLCTRRLRAGAAAHLPGLDQQRYWDARQQYEGALATRSMHEPGVALDALQRCLQQAVSAAAMPGCGGFLSGGVDSSLVMALAQSTSARPLPTVGIGFESTNHDESHWMQAVAAHLGVAHETVVFSAEQALPMVQRLPAVWGEPFADASQLPTLMASELLSQRCGLALTGDGGDELFFGHPAYRRAMRLASCSAWLPAPLVERARQVAERQGEAARLGGWPAVVQECSGQDVAHHYLMRISRWRQPLQLLPGVVEPRTLCRDGLPRLRGADAGDIVQYLDFAMELGNGLMTKVEAAGRACGLQTLSPLLERGALLHAWRTPMALKLRGGEQKWILKELLCRYLPRDLVYRPKRGFGPPVAAWLRGPLRGWAQDLLAPARLQAAGLADDGRVQRMWQAFLAGERRWHPLLWTLLMYMAWWEALPRRGACPSPLSTAAEWS